MKWLQGFSNLPKADKRKVFLAAASFLALVLLVLVENTQGDGFRQMASTRPFSTSLIVAGLLASVGLVVIATNNAIKRQRINKAASAIAIAGMVNPLLRVAYTLRVIAAALPDGADHNEYAEMLKRRTEAGECSPLKWVKDLLEKTSATEDAGSSSQTSDAPDWSNIRQMVQECTRCTVAKTRDWAPLLALTDEGMEALYCVQSLRVDLQAIEDELATKEPPTPGDIGLAIQTVGRRSLVIALAFEDASLPKERRWYLARELRRTPHCGMKGCADVQAGYENGPCPEIGVLARHSCTVCGHIARIRVEDQKAKPSRPLLAEQGWQIVREIYEQQDAWRMKATK